MLIAVVVLGFVTIQRLVELVHARRNTAHLLERGAYEVAPGHYPLVVVLHVAWLASLWLLAPGQPIVVFWLAVFVAAQVGRLWVLATLRDRWTTRIIILPGAPLVATGPYRYLSHPNYVVVAVEIAALPLAFDLPLCAIVFSLLNAAVLCIRIAAENAALKETRQVRAWRLGAPSPSP